MVKRVWSVAGLFVIAGCGSASSSALNSFDDAPLESETDARRWASVSAPNVYAQANTFPLLLGLMGSLPGAEADPECPKQTQKGNTTTIEGGCTDKNGNKWLGQMVDAREAAGSSTGKITFRSFGLEQTDTCNGQTLPSNAIFDGTVEISGTESALEFEVDLLITGAAPDELSDCAVVEETSAMEYQGSLANAGSKQTWNGSGRVGSSRIGVIRAETRDEVIDNNACDDEAASGTTTVTAGSNTIVYTYDGATQCDDDSRVKWSLNGEAKGELSGVRCAAASGPAAAFWAASLLLGTALLRRRTPPAPRRR